MKFLIETTIYLSVTAVLLLVFKGLFKNKLSAKWQVYIWALLLIRFFTPFLPQSEISVFNSITVPVEYNYEIKADRDMVQEFSDNALQRQELSEPEQAAEYKSNPIDVQNFAVGTWVAGGVILFLYFMGVYFVYIRKLRNLRSVEDTKTLEILEECKGLAGIKRNISVLLGEEKPVLIGLIKPKIILSEKYSYDEQRDIFLHELCHLKNNDILIIWLAVIILCFNWFNPVMWYSFFVLRRDIEVYCDERVLAYQVDKKAYAALLLKTALSKNKFVAGTTSLQNGEKEVERRIKYMAYFKKPKVIWTIIIFAVAAVVAGISLTNSVSEPANTGNALELSEHTAVVLDKTALYDDEEKRNKITDLEKGDIVHIVNKIDDLYFVQLPAMDLPLVFGYISDDKISFDMYDFGGCNYAVINGATVYNTEKGNNVYSESESGLIRITNQNWGGNFVECSLIGGVDGKWVKRGEIFLEFDRSEFFGKTPLYVKTHYYLQEEFYRVYSPYYDIQDLRISNWNENENEATFFYTMTAKNYYKDPDTVEYIIEARENGSEHYETLKREYLEPKDANYEFKIVLENGELSLYSNASPKYVKWTPTKIDDYVLPR